MLIGSSCVLWILVHARPCCRKAYTGVGDDGGTGRRGDGEKTKLCVHPVTHSPRLPVCKSSDRSPGKDDADGGLYIRLVEETQIGPARSEDPGRVGFQPIRKNRPVVGTEVVLDLQVAVRIQARQARRCSVDSG